MRFTGPASALFLLGAAPALLAGGPPALLKTECSLSFEGQAAMGYCEGGYQFSARSGEWMRMGNHDATMTPSNGSQYLEITSTPTTLVHVDGLEFDLLDLDLAEYSTAAIPEGDIRFEGTKSDGSILNFSVRLDRIIDGSGPLKDFEKVTFPAEWTGLTRVSILDKSVALDNVRVRGLTVKNPISAVVKPPVPLEVVGILQSNTTSNAWSLQRITDSQLSVTRTNASNNSVSNGIFNLATGKLGSLRDSDIFSGGNPQTGESCTVSSGVLTYTSGGKSRILARAGENGVTKIACPAVSNGKVIFANHGYQGREAYAVFMASATGVVPILTPQTLLPDGGTPGHYPYDLYFSGNSYAIPTSTSKTGSCYIASFNGGPFRIGPGVGQKVPGTATTISECEDLLWLDDASIGYRVNSSKSSGSGAAGHVVIVNADGSTSAASWPANLTKTIVPGSGFLQRCYGEAGYDRQSGIRLVTGPLECLDLAPNNLGGLVALLPDGSSRVLMRMKTEVPGFGTIQLIGARSAVADGMFYAAALNENKTVALLRGRIPAAAPVLRMGDFVPTADGTVRFLVENLTLGQAYRVESAPSSTGPWSECSRFTGGSPSRSVLGAFQRTPGEVFRVVEE